MSLFDQVSEDIKAAMLAKDKVKLQALRGVKKEFLEAKTSKGGDGELTDDAAVKIIQKMVKQRKESAEIYQTQGRLELAEAELEEVKAIEGYLPKQLTPDELETELKKIIADTGAEEPKDMGKVMGTANKRLAGKADGRSISEAVKRLLN